jgi:hypothetical protein
MLRNLIGLLRVIFLKVSVLLRILIKVMGLISSGRSVLLLFRLVVGLLKVIRLRILFSMWFPSLIMPQFLSLLFRLLILFLIVFLFIAPLRRLLLPLHIRTYHIHKLLMSDLSSLLIRRTDNIIVLVLVRIVQIVVVDVSPFV